MTILSFVPFRNGENSPIDGPGDWGVLPIAGFPGCQYCSSWRGKPPGSTIIRR